MGLRFYAASFWLIGWTLSPWMDPTHFRELIASCTFMGSILCFPLGLFVGHRSSDFGFSPFLSARPMASTPMAWIVLKAGGLGVAAGTAVWGLAVLFTSLWLIHLGHAESKIESLLSIGLLGWCVTPIAGAPLALAWNRHR